LNPQTTPHVVRILRDIVVQENGVSCACGLERLAKTTCGHDDGMPQIICADDQKIDGSSQVQMLKPIIQ
jgi:hypothetical protein